MKILILSQTFPLTPSDSTAHFMYDFACGFKKLGDEVYVLLPFHSKLKPDSFKGIKIKTFRYIWPDGFHLLGFGRTLIGDKKLHWYVYLVAPFYFLLGFFTLLNLVKKERFDVINAHWILPTGFIASLVSKIAGVPLIITLPGSDVYLAKKNFLFILMAKYAVRQAKKIISNSPQLLTDLKVKGKVISYGVPLNNGERIVNKKLTVATAGRMVEKKGFGPLRQSYPEIEIISNLPIDEFRRKLLSVDIFVAPSKRDTQGNLDDSSLVVLEAMAAGCAVVVSDLPGYRVIVKNGHNGILVDPDDSKGWQAAIERLKDSRGLRQKLGQAAKATIQKKFTPEKIALLYDKLV